MKRILSSIAAAAALATLASCSGEELQLDTTDTQEAPSLAEVITEPVEIQLGVPGLNYVTRAALDDDAEDLQLGIFCLAREKQELNKSEQDIRWWDQTVDPLFRSTFCLMNNVASTKSGSNITWQDGRRRYYPFTQFYSYDFYAYHPYVAQATTTQSIDTTQVGKVLVHYAALDGKTDILWGRGTSAAPYAYSAKYFRQAGHQTEVPSVQLDHMLTRLKFEVVPGESAVGSGDYSAAASMVITALRVKDVVKNVTLLVADLERDSANESGSEVLLGTDEPDRLYPTDDAVQTLSLCDETGSPFEAVTVSDNPAIAQPLGESFLLYPAAKYVLEISLRNTSNTTFQQDHPLELISPTGMFEAGRQYTITIEVHGPKEVNIKAQLTPWLDAGLTEEEQEDLNMEL